MALIDYPDLEELDEETAAILEMPGPDGEIQMFPRMLAHNPAVLEAAFRQYFLHMRGGTLDPDVKQLAFVVVSYENSCQYCAASHGRDLIESLGLPDDYLDAIAEGNYEDFSERQRTVARFARQGATDPKRVTQEHIEDLRAVGFDEGDVIELVSTVGLAQYSNTIADAMNVLPSDESSELGEYYSKTAPAQD